MLTVYEVAPQTNHTHTDLSTYCAGTHTGAQVLNCCYEIDETSSPLHGAPGQPGPVRAKSDNRTVIGFAILFAVLTALQSAAFLSLLFR